MIDVTYNVPQLLATGAAPNVSDKYNYISSQDVHDIMGYLGWRARVGYTVTSKKQDPLYGKHMIRYVNSGSGNVGDRFAEIIMINSHNGATSFTLKGGIFELVCSNGLTICTENYGTMSVRHNSDLSKDRFDFMDAVSDYAMNVNTITGIADHWSTIQMSMDERMDFYSKASTLRSTGMTESELIAFDQPQREADRAHSLWKVFNRTQEYLVRGGYRATSASNNRQRQVREIQGIDSLDKVNSDLFTLANEVALAN